MTTFNKVNTVKKYFKYSECKAGDVLVNSGEYLGTSPSQFGKPNHDFKDGTGIVSLNSSGQLNYLVETYVKKGDVVRIVYSGKDKLDKGAFAGKEAHKFELFLSDAPKAAEGTPAKIEPPKDTNGQYKLSLDSLE